MKEKKIYIIIILASLLSVFCLINIFLPQDHYYYQGEVFINDDIESSVRTVYKKIPLSLGIYDVKLEYESEADMRNYSMLTDSTVFDGGLRTDLIYLDKNQDNVEFHIGLFESTRNLELQIFYCGEGDLSIRGIHFYETNDLWTILLSVIWGLAGLIIGFIKLREKQCKTESNRIINLILFLIILTSSLPCLYGESRNGIDLLYHLKKIEVVKGSILSGDFSIQTEPYLYIPAFFRMIGYSITTSYNIYCILVNIATVLISYFCFKKIFVNQYIGLLCSALYTLSIYRIYKMFVLSAIGEVSAILFFPLLFYALYRIASDDKISKKMWILLAVTYAGLIQTHIMSFVIALVITLIIAVVFLMKNNKKEIIVEAGKGTFMAIILSIFYIVPLFERYFKIGYVTYFPIPESIQAKGLYLPQLFLNWWKPGDNHNWDEIGMQFSQPVGVGFILGFFFVLFCILWFSDKLKTKGKVLFFCKIVMIIAGISMFMSLNIFPWDRIQKTGKIFGKLIPLIRRPDAFLGIGVMCLVMVAGGVLFYSLDKKQYFYFASIGILIGIVTSSVYLLDYICFEQSFLYIFSSEGIRVADVLIPSIQPSNSMLWWGSNFISLLGWAFIIYFVIKHKAINQREERK